MQDYCSALGGALRIESIQGQGTAVIAEFPCECAASAAVPKAVGNAPVLERVAVSA